MKQMFDPLDVYVKAPNQGTMTWFDGIPWNVRGIIFDEFRGDLHYATLLDLLGGYSTRVEKKGFSTIVPRVSYVIITSNFAPWEEPIYPKLTAEDRKPLYRRLTSVKYFPAPVNGEYQEPEDRTNEIRF